MDKIDAELIAAGIDPERLAHETSVLVRVMKEKYELQAKLDRVTELVGKWRALVQEDIGLLCGECVTNCADDLEQALKEGEK